MAMTSWSSDIPAGLPQKIAGGAKVRSIQTGFFVANLETDGGNSGSAVFNLSNGVIEGILYAAITISFRKATVWFPIAVLMPAAGVKMLLD